MKTLVRTIGKKSINEMRQELVRAHFIIALLAISIVVLLGIGAVEPVQFDQTLAAVAIALLILVVLISVFISCLLMKLKK
jgi:hypothetical protein